MQVNPQDHHEHVEHLDADAVCEACDTVNPEGTLLCKTCGNNLRDQRARRMKAGGRKHDDHHAQLCSCGHCGGGDRIDDRRDDRYPAGHGSQ